MGAPTRMVAVGFGLVLPTMAKWRSTITGVRDIAHLPLRHGTVHYRSKTGIK